MANLTNGIGAKFAGALLDWDRSSRQGSPQGDPDEQHDDPRRRARHRQVCTDEPASLWRVEEAKGAVYLHDLRGAATRRRTGYGVFRVGHRAFSRIRPIAVHRLLLVQNGAGPGSSLRSLCEGPARSSLGNECSLQHDGRDENVWPRSRLRRLSNRNVYPRPGGAPPRIPHARRCEIMEGEGTQREARPILLLPPHPLRAYVELDDLLFYVVDGILDVRFSPGFAERGLLVKQFRVRRMKGAPHETYWVTFSVTSKGVTEVELPLPVLSTERVRTGRKK